MLCFVCKGKAFVMWFYLESGFAGYLCQKHFDIWLDNADDDPALEPDDLAFL